MGINSRGMYNFNCSFRLLPTLTTTVRVPRGSWIEAQIAKERLSASVITFQEYDELLLPILEKNDFMGEWGQRAKKSGIKPDTAIFWDKAAWTSENEGCVLQEGGKKCKCMWAALEQKKTGKTLLVASLHLTSGKKKKDILERKKELDMFAPALAEIAQRYDAFVIGADTNDDTGAELLHQWFGRELTKWPKGEVEETKTD